MWIVFLVILGAASGFIASRIMRVETDLMTTIFIGIVGALIGGVLLRFVAGVLGLLGGFVGAVLGAMLVIYLWQQVRK